MAQSEGVVCHFREIEWAELLEEDGLASFSVDVNNGLFSDDRLVGVLWICSQDSS